MRCIQDEDEDEEETHQLALYVDTNQPSESSCVTLTLSKDMTSGIWMFSSVTLSEGCQLADVNTTSPSPTATKP